MNKEPRQLSDILEEVIVQNRENSGRHEHHLKRIGDFLERGPGAHGSEESIGLLKEILSELRLIREARVSPSTKTDTSSSIKTPILQRVRKLFKRKGER